MLYQISGGNEVNFIDLMKVLTKISAQNRNLIKLRHGFVNEKAMIKATLILSCHWKTLVPLSLRKKRPENEYLTLTVHKHYC